MTNDTSWAGGGAVWPGVPGSEDNFRAQAALAFGRSGAPVGDRPDARTTPTRGKLLCWFSLITFCLLSTTRGADVTDLRTQKELSEVAGVFSASRFLVYQRSDERYLYFKEHGKFGPFGPAREFKISSKVFAPQAPEPGSVLTYDQNKGVFYLRGKNREDVIKTDFTEKYTREEEQYLIAVTTVKGFGANDASLKKREALLNVMRWSFHAGHTEETERYAQELLLMEHRKPMRDDGSNRVHNAHTLMGLIALGRNNVPAAKESLLSSVREAPETATICSFGPNMHLAQELQKRGENGTVIQYLKLCERLWTKDTLKRWQQEIERGQTPHFSNSRFL